MYFRITRRSKASSKWKNITSESSGGSSFSPRSTTHPRVPEGQHQRKCRFSCSVLPEPATEHDRSGSSSLTPVDGGGIFLMRACGLRTRLHGPPVLAWVGWCPAPRARFWVGSRFASSDFRHFRAHGSRMRIGDLSVPAGRFVARVSAAVTTADRRPGRGAIFPGADTTFASFFALSFEDGTGSAEDPSAATAVAQHAPSPTSTSQGADPVAITDSAAFALSPPGDPAPPTALPPSGRISNRTRQRTAASTGTAMPAVDYYGVGPGGAPRPSARRANTPPRVPRPRPPVAVVTAPALAVSPAPTVPIPSGRDRAEPVGIPLSRLSPSPDVLSATTADLDALGVAAELQFGDSAACY